MSKYGTAENPVICHSELLMAAKKGFVFSEHCRAYVRLSFPRLGVALVEMCPVGGVARTISATVIPDGIVPWSDTTESKKFLDGLGTIAENVQEYRSLYIGC